MHVLTVENLAKSQGTKVLLANVSFGLEAGEKVGLIGVNGTGKSTLLKILAGAEWPDQGKIMRGNDLRLAYLPQNPVFAEGITVLEQVFQGNTPEMRLLKAYEEAVEALADNPEQLSLQKKVLSLGQQMDAQGVWQLEKDAKTILTKLGIVRFDMPVGVLSGGQRKRVALAGALIDQADILILDEPTNHLDHETVDWLEQYLYKRKGALLIVTHDRYFLDRVVSRILELEGGQLYSYTGNYSRFLERKAERAEQAEVSEKKRQNLYRSELDWIRRGARARTTKQKARLERFEKIKAAQVPKVSERIEMPVGSARLGKKIIACSQVSKAFSGRGIVIGDFDYVFLRDDRIGLIGPNGSGKSTLLNMLAGSLLPDGGSIERGSTVKIGYFAQESTHFDPQRRVIEEIKAVGEMVPAADGRWISAAQMLERFLFPGPVQWTQIGDLSGGEKRRLYLLRILMGAPNLLLLDEPTNDLDIQTLSILENYLEDFPGAVVAASHDRYFLDRMADKIFAFEGQGKIRSYPGNYSDYQEQVYAEKRNLEQASGLAALSEAFPGRDKGTGQDGQTQKKERPLKMTFKEQQEFNQIDDQITLAEKELAENERLMREMGGDYEKLIALAAVHEELEQKLNDLLDRWTYLNELAEKIEQRS